MQDFSRQIWAKHDTAWRENRRKVAEHGGGETAEQQEESLRGKSRFVEAIEEGRRKSRSQVSMEANEILGMIKAGKAWQSKIGNRRRKELIALTAALTLLLASSMQLLPLLCPCQSSKYAGKIPASSDLVCFSVSLLLALNSPGGPEGSKGLKQQFIFF